MLDYGKDCFRTICKGIKTNKSCFYIQVAAVMVNVQKGLSAATKAIMTVNDH